MYMHNRTFENPIIDTLYMYVFLGKENMEPKTFEHMDLLCTDSERWTTNRSSER